MALLVTGSACGVGTGGAWRSSGRRATGDLSAQGVSVSVGSVAAPGPGGATSLSVTVTQGTARGWPQVFIDADDDRGTGMWTFQSSLSASGWDLLVDDEGHLYRHDGQQNAWRWREIDVPAFRRMATSGRMELSIPGSLLKGWPFRVRVAAENKGHWHPTAFLPGVPFPPEAVAVPAPRPGPPAPLAIHYGRSPWLVRDCRPVEPVECGARAFAQFSHVVLSAGLEEATHPSHERTRQLVAAIRSMAPAAELWGYVSLVGGPPDRGMRSVLYTVGDIRSRAAAWKALGATGVFLDEADLCRPARDQCAKDMRGEEFAVTRARQAAVVDAIHDLGMPVFTNGFGVPDILGVVDGRPSSLTGPGNGRPADMYLLENLTISAGRRVTGFDAAVGHARLELALRYAAGTGVRLAAVDTVHDAAPDLSTAHALYREGLARATKAGLEAYGFTNSSYSSEARTSTNLALPAGGSPHEAALPLFSGSSPGLTIPRSNRGGSER